MGAIIGLLMLLLGSMSLFGFFILPYLFMGLGLSKIAKNEGKGKRFLAWIPIINIVLLGMLVEDDVYEKIRGKFTIIIGVSMFLALFIGKGFITYLPLALSIYAFFFIANRYSKNVTAHTVIAVITFGLSMPFQLFRFRKRKPLTKIAY